MRGISPKVADAITYAIEKAKRQGVGDCLEAEAGHRFQASSARFHLLALLAMLFGQLQRQVWHALIVRWGSHTSGYLLPKSWHGVMSRLLCILYRGSHII
jgi:hypothetical protein